MGMARPRPAPALSLAVCPIVALQLSKLPLHSPSVSRLSQLSPRFTHEITTEGGTSEWGPGPAPAGRETDRPTDRPTGRVGGRETCVYRKRTFPLAMSIAYCQRRTRRTPPHAHAHEYCPGPTQLRLDSCSCAHPNEKVGRHPPTHPLLFVPPKLQ